MGSHLRKLDGYCQQVDFFWIYQGFLMISNHSSHFVQTSYRGNKKTIFQFYFFIFLYTLMCSKAVVKVATFATSCAKPGSQRLNRVSQKIDVRIGWLLNFNFGIEGANVDALYSFLVL